MVMNVHYSKVCEERNELQTMAAMKFDDVRLNSPKEDECFVTLNKSLKQRDQLISQFISGRGAPIWKFSNIPITDILATKITDSDIDTDI